MYFLLLHWERTLSFSLKSLKIIKASVWLKLVKIICCPLLIKMTAQSKLLHKQAEKHPLNAAECTVVFLPLALVSVFPNHAHNSCGGQQHLT